MRLAVFPLGGNTDETFELALTSSITAAGTPSALVTPVPGGDVFDVQWTP